MSTTPRTDEEADFAAPEKLFILARTMERELSACRAELTKRDEDERRLLEDIERLGKEAEESERLLLECRQELNAAQVIAATETEIAERSEHLLAAAQAPEGYAVLLPDSEITWIVGAYRSKEIADSLCSAQRGAIVRPFRFIEAPK